MDNTCNNSTEEVHTALDLAFDGRWQHLPVYSPCFESVFFDKKIYSREREKERESEGERDPKVLIGRMFQYYSFGAEEGTVGKQYGTHCLIVFIVLLASHTFFTSFI